MFFHEHNTCITQVNIVACLNDCEMQVIFGAKPIKQGTILMLTPLHSVSGCRGWPTLTSIHTIFHKGEHP